MTKKASFLFLLGLILGISFFKGHSQAQPGPNINIYPVSYNFDDLFDWGGLSSGLELYLKIMVSHPEKSTAQFVGYYRVPDKKELALLVQKSKPLVSFPILKLIEKICSENDHCPLDKLILKLELVEDSRFSGPPLEEMTKAIDKGDCSTSCVLNLKEYEKIILQQLANRKKSIVVREHNALHPESKRFFYDAELMAPVEAKVGQMLADFDHSKDNITLEFYGRHAVLLQTHPFVEYAYEVSLIPHYYYFSADIVLSQ